MRKLICFLLVVSMAMASTLTVAFASDGLGTIASDNYSITSEEELASVLAEEVDSNNNITVTERNEVFSETDPKVLADYISDSVDIAMERCEQIFNDGTCSMNGESSKVIEEEITEGINMEIILNDQEEPSFAGQVFTEIAESIIPSVYASSGSESTTINKDFGDRRYTAVVNLTISDKTFAKLCLVNHYTISKQGLDMRSADVTGTTGYLVAEVPSAVAVETDKVARSEGANIDCKGSYKVVVTVPYLDIHIQTKYATIWNYVTLKDLHATSADVVQHATFTY